MFTAENKVGQLCELRSRSTDGDDFEAFITAARALVSSLPGQVVICVDCRELSLLNPQTASRFIWFLRQISPRIERGALLISKDKALFGLQASRIVRESGSPRYQVFRRANELVDWLGEVLTAEEQARLEFFVAPGAEAHLVERLARTG